MFKVAKCFSFDMAHLLDGHDGKCKNLHGHTYQLQVEVKGELYTNGPKRGMVIDFGDLKTEVQTHILSKLDHAFIYDRHNLRESKIADLLKELDSKIFAVETRTTAEELARFIYDELHQKAHLPISKITLWETPTSYCEYGGE